MLQINIADLDQNLIADLGNDLDGWEAFEAEYDRATVSNQRYHIVFSNAHERGGIVFVGSGSSGVTHWTDAKSAEDVLRRFLADDLCN